MNGRILLVRLGLRGDGELLNGQFLGISPQLFIFLSNFDQSNLPETRCQNQVLEQTVLNLSWKATESIVFDKLRIKVIK